MSVPSLPPIKQPKHRLDVERASHRVRQNYQSCQDNGLTSVSYQVVVNPDETVQTEIIKILKTNTTGNDYFVRREHDLKRNNLLERRTDKSLVLKSVDEWRINSNPYVQSDQEGTRRLQPRAESRANEPMRNRENVKKQIKSSSVVWEELEGSSDARNPVNHILSQRKKFGWNITLPVYGYGASAAMRCYQDRFDTEIFKTLDDDGVFVYCLCLSDIYKNILYAPYELRIVNKELAMSSKVFFTVSASCIVRTEVDDVEEPVVRPVMEWLWEKKLFDMLRKIRTFNMFRKWRTFKCWRMNVRVAKQEKARNKLTRRLFTANEVFQGVLLHVRMLCERASGSRDGLGIGENAIILIKYDPSVTQSLDDFNALQNTQMQNALTKLKLLKEEVMNLAYISCITVGELEGIDFEAFFQYETYTHQQTFIDYYLNHRDTKTTRLRDMNFYLPATKESGPSYAKRKEWRFILLRICEFLRSIDYQIQELLHRVVKTSALHLYDYVSKSSQLALESNRRRLTSASTSEHKSEFTDENTRSIQTPDNLTLLTQSNHSLIRSNVQIGFEDDTEEEDEGPGPLTFKTGQDIDHLLEQIKIETTVERLVEPIFNTYLVLNVETSTKSKEGSIPAEADDKNDEWNEESPEDEPVQNLKKDNLEPKVFVTLSPNASDFKNFFKDLLGKYEDTVGQIQTLLHEPQFQLFCQQPIYELTQVEKDVRATMELNHEYAFDGKRPWPEVQFLFGEDENYQDILADIMRNITASLTSLTNFSDEYKKYCQMVISTIKLNIAQKLQQDLTPDDYQYLLSLHTEEIHAMNTMTTEKRVCFFEAHAYNFQKDCLPYPNAVIKSIDDFMPQMAVSRNEKLQETMRDALKMLDRDPSSVEDFVEHLATLSRINNDLPNLEKEFQTVTRLFNISNEFNLSIRPEQYAFFKSLGSTFHHLKSSLLYTEAQCEENIRKFSVDLNALIIKVHRESVDLRERLQAPVLLSVDTNQAIAKENLMLFQEMIEKLMEKAKNYASYQERFGNTMKQVKKKTGPNDYGYQDFGRSGVTILTLQNELNELEQDINLRRLLWKSIAEWDQLVREWLNQHLEEIVVSTMQKDVNRFTQNIYLLEKGLPHNELVPKLKDKVLDFKKALPIIIALRNPNLKARHYHQLKLLIGHDLTSDQEKVTMSVLLEADVLQYREKISEISALATNEATLETMLNRISDIWKKTDFRLVVDQAKDTFIMTGTEEIQILLEESQITMATIKSSRYVTPIKNQVEDMDRRLVLFSKTLEEWVNCQKKWLYLKQIFSTPDIQRQLSQETKIFNQIEKFWKDLMRRTEDKPNALRAATAPGLFESLQSYGVQMEKIQRSLEEYFETKRLIFPRLYFLSNEELLDILSQSKDPQKIQSHLIKCFGNINGLEISSKLVEITHLISFEGEKLEMTKTVRIRGATEQWLGALENGMYESIKRHLKHGLADYQKNDYRDWIVKHAGQVVLLVSQINFNKNIVTCLTSPQPHDSLKDYLSDHIRAINTVTEVATKETINHKLLTAEALLIIEVHARDILTNLIENKISSIDDFEWSRHLRYEWDDHSNQCYVKQSDSVFNYGYEYLGCSPRLVITPLTDRCYLTLTGALKLNLGGAPAGPAGTGKTETVKDLAKSVGKLCLVFNCSEGLDYKMLGKFFSGLVQSGSWCCFDEFNRIDIEVLSVVAQQMLSIKTAKDSLAPRFNFEGREIKLNNTCGFFITMNPTYAGRVELPDNLKPLYRPVAMMVPDYALIAEIILFSVGFTSAKNLATKIVTLYHLASRQLSQQDHYDFGMRAIKAVLMMAGQSKKNFISENQDLITYITEYEESQILMQALYDTNLPKFLKEDVNLFLNLMSDLFPGSEKLTKNQEAIRKSINIATRELNFQNWPSQAEKIIQLYDQMLVRHGIMLVGPTGSGKTVSRNILSKALTILPTFMNDKTEKLKSQLNVKFHPAAQIAIQKKQEEMKKLTELKVLQTMKSMKITEKLAEAQKHVQVTSTETIKPNEVNFSKLNLIKKTKETAFKFETPKTFQEEVHKLKPKLDEKLSKLINKTDDKLKSKKGRVETFIINPKSIDIGELYGSTDPNTFEWSDGVFANSIRSFASSVNSSANAESEHDTSSLWQFMILDGPVDTYWVENLNTVLDDSKVLCLSSGERINMTPSIRIVFEVDSLVHTSPATVSRCAMVYFEPSDLGLTPCIKNWLNSLPEGLPNSGVEILNDLINMSIYKGFEFIEKRKGSTSFVTHRQNILNCMFGIISAYLEFFESNGGFGENEATDQQQAQEAAKAKKLQFKRKSKDKSVKESDEKTEQPAEKLSKKQYYLHKNPKQLPALLTKIYIFAYIWGFGGVLKREDNAEDDNIINQKSHVKTIVNSLTHDFDELVREIFESNVKYGIYLPPAAKPVFDYFIDVVSGAFVEWNVLVPSVEALIKKGKQVGDDMIETIDSVRFTFLSTLLLMGKHPVLITGSSGVGKTLVIQNMLKKLVDSGFGFKPNTILGDVFNYGDKNKVASSSNTMSLFNEEPDHGNRKLKIDEFNIIVNNIQFSAQTTSNKFLTLFGSKLTKKGLNHLGAPKNKWIVTFIDDLNIPIADKSGDQPPLELLRFIIENDGFHDIKNVVFKNVTDVTFVVTCDPPNSGRNLVSPRLLRQFCIMSMPDPSARSLLNIYQVQLGRYFTENEFNIEIKSQLLPLVSSGIVMYYRVFINMLPTPSKAHYIFNLRDLSRLIKGLMQASPNVVVTKENLVDLFSHECIRVFNDRLISQEDNKLFYRHLEETVLDYFKINFPNPFGSTIQQPGAGSSNQSDTHRTSDSHGEENTATFLYGDFLKNDDRVYQQLNNWKQLVSVLSEYEMRRSNVTGHVTKQIVFFKEAVEHICRAARVLRQPGGHLLLIGLDGTGKNTIIELAAFISNCEMFQLNLKKGYSYNDFRDDLKAVFKQAGIQRKKLVFFIADKDIYDELFLEDIDSLLTSGNIPDLFDFDELDSLLMEVKTEAMNEGITDEKSELNKFLINRVKNNLHIVLSMSPVGNKFRERCRFHPSLINCTTIDWFNDWSEFAMKQVSMSSLESVEFKIGAEDLDFEVENHIRMKISKACVYMHSSMIRESKRFFDEHKRYYYVTPSCYIDLLRTFSKIFETKKNEYIDNLNRLKTGLQKLSEANELVAIMKEELVTLGPQIEEKAKETEILMEKLQKDQAAVNEVHSIVEKESAKMKEDTELVSEYALEAEKDLENVIEVIELARTALNALDKADISEIRVYNSPPFLVMTVMCAVCVILGKKADWTTAKLLLADPAFITKMVNFNAENVTDKTYAKLKQYSKNPDFEPEIVGKVSKACKSLCYWVKAVEKFYEVYRTVKPKELRVKEAREALEVMRAGLQRKEHMLEQIQKHLDNFKKKYEESLNERNSLENRKELMKIRMVRASELTSALDVEKIRWSQQYEELKQQADRIIGIALISSGAVNYLGAMTQDYRTKLINEWINYIQSELYLEIDSSFNLSKNFVKPHIIRTWINQQLPDDQYSIENAIFLKYSLKWPLIIDPQNQVVRWIKEMEGSSLKICKSEDPLVFRTLEQAIRLGQPVLIENVGEFIDPILDPILQKQILSRGAQKIIKLGDVEVEYNDSFRLYLITSLPNPHYLPSAFIKVNLINFTITYKCLFEQFLSLVVLKERPELEKERSHLLNSIAKDFATLRELEDRSLSILSSTETDSSGSSQDGPKSLEAKSILDDQNLVDVLKQSKKTSIDISNRLKKNEETEKSLNLARQKYSEIATRATILYFSVQNLSSLNVMYQFSLNWFYNVFQSCLGNFQASSQENINPGSEQPTNTAKSQTLLISENGLLSNIQRELSSKSTKFSQSVSSLESFQPEGAVKTFNSESEFDFYIKSILDLLTHTVYQVVSWALFAEHQLLFSFTLSANILKHKENKTIEKINKDEYRFFLYSGLLADMQHEVLSEKASLLEDKKFMDELMLDEKVLKQVLLLEDTLPNQFKDLSKSIQANTSTVWMKFMSHSDPYKLIESQEIQTEFTFKSLTKFQRLILIKLLRSDALISAIRHFINETLGQKFLNAGIPTLQDLYNQSHAHTPIIFILSPGSDPTNQLLRFARETRGSSLHLDIVSLGKGQGVRAEELINKSLILKGRWILLQNCHLALSFMPRLEAIVNNFNRPGAEIDKQFRLFLSSKPDGSFPISLLKNGIKMTIESPRGLKNNLKQNFGPGGYITRKIFESAENGEHWRRLLYNLGFIHALIHERKKFGTLGWNLPYEFNNSDLEVAILQMQSILSLNPTNVPFNVLKYIAGEVIYGGRVTDDYDRRCLLSILGNFFSNTAIQNEYFYDANKMYAAPSKSIDHGTLIEYIDNLPVNDDPSLFGMNIYAEKLLLSTSADQLISSVVSMEPSQKTKAANIGKNEAEVVIEIGNKILSELPEKIITTFEKGKHLTLHEALEKLKEKLGDSYYENSAMNTILRQEIERFNILLNVIFKTITELIKALKGEIIISKSTEAMYASILLQKVPEVWEAVSYPSLKPLALWTKDLLRRTQFFSSWAKMLIQYVEGTSTMMNPHSLWISGFFFPQGLLAAISQNYARKLHVSIDSLVFQYEVLNHIFDQNETDIQSLFDNSEKRFMRQSSQTSETKEDGILICGLFMDGGKWDRNENRILDSPQRFLPMPHFLCKLVPKQDLIEEGSSQTKTSDQDSKADEEGRFNKYKCPVYRNSVRAGNSNDQAKNFVTSIDLNCRESSEFWILRGLCMILQE